MVAPPNPLDANTFFAASMICWRRCFFSRFFLSSIPIMLKAGQEINGIYLIAHRLYAESYLAVNKKIKRFLSHRRSWQAPIPGTPFCESIKMYIYGITIGSQGGMENFESC
jgi:hypothetical protein